MTDDLRYLQLLRALTAEFPAWRLQRKRLHWYWRLAGLLARLLGDGGRFMTTRTTMLGPIIAIPESWDTHPVARKYITLCHERVHLRQCRRFGLGSLWLGILPMHLCYALLPLPLGLAWCRYRMERTAYTATLRAMVECYGPQQLEGLHVWLWALFTGRAYWWCWLWPGAAERWAQCCIARVQAEMTGGDQA